MPLEGENMTTRGQAGNEVKDSFQGLTYEQAFSELETIVATLESGERPLDETLALFERGQGLARYCSELLEKAELKVQQLSGDTLTNFTPQG
jgi:exodeoxyribonuclease VII small subunit